MDFQLILKNLTNNRFNFIEYLTVIGWYEYFNLDQLYAPVVLVKEFWRFVNASTYREVSSVVLGIPIKITQQTIVDIIKCLDEGMIIKNGDKSRIGSFKINKEIFEDPKVNSKSIHLKCK